ncbi:MAG: sigma 54-interacting transcriptional regulator [Planctomycetota bacterium]
MDAFLLVDGLQHWDEVSIDLIIELCRLLRPDGLRLILAFREEGPASKRLAELSSLLLSRDVFQWLTLGPLDVPSSLKLYRRSQRLSGYESKASNLSVFQETSGLPYRILSLSGFSKDDSEPTPALGESLPKDDRCILATLALLERPVSVDELSSATSVTAETIRVRLGEWRSSRFIEDASEDRKFGLLVASATCRRAFDALSVEVRRKIHRSIADWLLASDPEAGDPRLSEAVEHLRKARSVRALSLHGHSVAKHYRESQQNQKALDLLLSIREVTPESHRKRRAQIALEIAELCARVGELDRGLDVLRESHSSRRGRSDALEAETLLQTGVLQSRHGNLSRADALFRSGIEHAAFEGIHVEKRLLFFNEWAAMKVFLEDFESAEQLCDRGLREANKEPESLSIRDARVSLLATQANALLRSNRWKEACAAYESALEQAEAIGSLASLAAILNNLAKVYSQLDRHREALNTFSAAERVCLRVDEGSSLLAIRCNLAILHARFGDSSKCEAALKEAENSVRSSMGSRESFFFRHAAGLARLIEGRYDDARRDLLAAIREGTQLGDRFVVSFDRLYLIECDVLCGRYHEAREELNRLEASELPRVQKGMLTARKALLLSVLGDEDGVATCLREYSDLEPKAESFLDAWNHLILAWSAALSENSASAVESLAAATSYFEREGLLGPLRLASYVDEERRFASGLTAASERFSASRRTDYATLATKVVHARRLASDQSSPQARERLSDLLADTGAELASGDSSELRARWEFLTGALAGDPSEATRLREELAGRFEEADRTRYLNSAAWRRWTDLDLEALRPTRRSSGDAAKDTTTQTVEWSRVGVQSLICESSAMRRLESDLKKIRSSSLPVLILGETGSGKELVARKIHAESARGARPLRVLDCASLPATLAASELFGAKAGAYSGQESDREGMITSSNGGTLLVDNIDQLPLDVQAQLLRAIDTSRIRPLGSDTEVDIDVRFLCSSSESLESLVDQGRFRADLYHRIRVLEISIPPLRERHDDLPGLVTTFYRSRGLRAAELSRSTLHRLKGRGWPGNVRELFNVLERDAIEGNGLGGDRLEDGGTSPITTSLDSVSLDESPRFLSERLLGDHSLEELREQVDREYLLYHLERLHGDIEALSRHLGIRRRQLYNRCKKLRIDVRTEIRRLTESNDQRDAEENRNGPTTSS